MIFRLIVVCFLSLLSAQLSFAQQDPVKPVIGYAEIPIIHELLWDEKIENGGTKYSDPHGSIWLYLQANDEFPVIIATGFSELVYDRIEHDSVKSVMIFGVQANWFQIRTAEGLLLWMKRSDTVNYQSYTDLLKDLTVTFYSGLPAIYPTPSFNTSPITIPFLLLDEDWMHVEETKIIDGELWVLLEFEYNEITHGGTEVYPFDERFGLQGWMKAHDTNGHPAFGLIAMC